MTIKYATVLKPSWWHHQLWYFVIRAFWWRFQFQTFDIPRTKIKGRWIGKSFEGKCLIWNLNCYIFFNCKLLFLITKIFSLLLKGAYISVECEGWYLAICSLLAQFILTVVLCRLTIHSEISLYWIRGDFKEFPQ